MQKLRVLCRISRVRQVMVDHCPGKTNYRDDMTVDIEQVARCCKQVWGFLR